MKKILQMTDTSEAHLDYIERMAYDLTSCNAATLDDLSNCDRGITCDRWYLDSPYYESRNPSEWRQNCYYNTNMNEECGAYPVYSDLHRICPCGLIISSSAFSIPKSNSNPNHADDDNDSYYSYDDDRSYNRFDDVEEYDNKYHFHDDNGYDDDTQKRVFHKAYHGRNSLVRSHKMRYNRNRERNGVVVTHHKIDDGDDGNTHYRTNVNFYGIEKSYVDDDRNHRSNTNDDKRAVQNDDDYERVFYYGDDRDDDTTDDGLTGDDNLPKCPTSGLPPHNGTWVSELSPKTVPLFHMHLLSRSIVRSWVMTGKAVMRFAPKLDPSVTGPNLVRQTTWIISAPLLQQPATSPIATLPRSPSCRRAPMSSVVLSRNCQRIYTIPSVVPLLALAIEIVCMMNGPMGTAKASAN